MNRFISNFRAAPCYSAARFAAIGLLLQVLAVGAAAQQIVQRNRITQPVDNSQRLTLSGHVHPSALPEYDQGRVSPSLQLSYATLTLSPSAAQQAELDQLLADQQNPASANYHRWITPEEYGQRFGASEADLNTISTWLQSQGLKVEAVARGRAWIAFSGSAAQVEAAFQTEIHHYLVNGELHFANAAAPSIPVALSGVLRGVRGLHDFRLKPSNRLRALPEYTTARGVHYIVPDDFATIYDVKPLYAAGINGSGQKLVIAGQTEINMSDIEQFRSMYGLPANNPQPLLVPGSQNPGISSNDLPEADLDLELSGAVARNASIIYVYASDVTQAEQYAIDQNLAPVMSVSYGACEQETLSSDLQTFRSWAQQGNAQGMTWFAASGDSGAADCDDEANPGLAVDTPASIPEVTGLGGTEFVEGSGQYWSSTNSSTQASALSYIPETTWNDSAISESPDAGGGGASVVFGKPSWQTGPGVPGDNARDVPDLSLSASNAHDVYYVYTGGSLQGYGGTSVAAPSFAGIATLLNEYLVSNGAQTGAGLGNLNPSLYALAQTNPGAFHDVTTGNNIVTVPCAHRRTTCTSTPVGYSAGVGYDQATGLGSVDAYKLVTGWNSKVSTAPSPDAITLLTNLNTVSPTEVMYLIATVTGAGGATPAGSVTFEDNGTAIGSAALAGSAGTATATLIVTGSQLPAGAGTITAVYSNPSNVTASLTVNVTSSGSSSNGTPVITALANPFSYQPTFAPGGILSVFGSQLAPSPASAAGVPLPVSIGGVAALVNGEAAPLYYVSPGLINVQIPYEINPGTVTVSINNNGAVVSQSFTVAAAAPAIHVDQNYVLSPTGSAVRGQEIAIYITGAGAVSPAVSTGAAPSSSTALANLPVPTQAVSVTVGGTRATIDAILVPTWSVGVTQINFTVPATITTGAQSVVVTVGGVSSAAGTLNVTN
jgi:uncharacterized protein (TIGR03437 family)